MNTPPPAGGNRLRSLFDAIPSYVFAVDEDLRILEYNSAASGLVGESRELVLKRRGGEAFHCIHSKDVPEGCGRGPHCRTCVIRSAVREAFDGNRIVRRRTKMELEDHDKIADVYVLVTASPFEDEGRRLVVLVLEDVSSVIELQCLIPICSKCKRVRADKDYWTKLETYARDHLGADFSHGYCPDCFAEEMKAMEKLPPRPPKG